MNTDKLTSSSWSQGPNSAPSTADRCAQDSEFHIGYESAYVDPQDVLPRVWLGDADERGLPSGAR